MWVNRRKGNGRARGSGLRSGEVGCPIGVPKEGGVVSSEVEVRRVAPGRRVEGVVRGEDDVVHPEVLVGRYRDPGSDEVECPVVITEGRREDSILAGWCGGEVG